MKSVVVNIVAEPRALILGEGFLTKKGAGKVFKN